MSTVKPLRWNAEKNNLLKRERGVSFENIVVAIEGGGLLDVLAHPNRQRYPGQKILVVSYGDYVYLVPFVEEDQALFLKTIIPSRKATRDYLNPGASDAQPDG
ncbi:BrnT family toxin [Ottowia sp.]|uniref:BrnT family toxin n=1 Tax=Ottowia sp. TaxID=1898956 RepID=UPI0039556BB6